MGKWSGIEQILRHVKCSCSQELSKEERELVQKWFKIAAYKATLLELVLSSQIEIIGFSKGEPVIRTSDSQLN